MSDETNAAVPDGSPRALAEAKRLSRAGRGAEAWQIATERLGHDPLETATLKLVVQLADRHGWYAAGLPFLDAAIAASAPDWQSYWRYRAAYLARWAGDTTRAIAYLEAIIAREPNAASAHNEIGMIHRAAGDTEQALHWVAAAEEAAPSNADFIFNQAVLHSLRHESAAELATYRRAVAANPRHGNARAGLVRCLERQNALDAAEAELGAAEAVLGRTPKLHALATRLALRRGDPESAQQLLETLPWQGLDRSAYLDTLFLAGQVYDRLGATHQAMACFAEGNAYLASSDQARPYDKTEPLSEMARLQAGITAARVADWPAPQPGTADAATPVFLVGFPRSGTTLLELALASHPGATVLEERPIVPHIVQVLRKLDGGYPQSFFKLRDDQRARLRELYFHTRGHFLAADESRLVVDKLPLNSRHIAIMYRLFPEAKILFALRHPGDAVLSCFMQAFTPNADMNNFYSLADTTRFYDQAMRLWQQYLALLPLPVATVPYEAVVADFNNVVADVLGFLGLPWDEAVGRYREQASKAAVRTPSYAQVSQPLYTTSRYRWQRYTDALAEVLPTLRGWAAWFGYSEDDDGTITAPGFHQR